MITFSFVASFEAVTQSYYSAISFSGVTVTQPRVVRDAVARYREDKDWLAHFLNDCCVVDMRYSEKSGDLYNAYRSYCSQTGEYFRRTTDFYTALECAGFERKRLKAGVMVYGLMLQSDFLE